MHGEPDAWKLARPVREEGWRNLSPKGDGALHLYFHGSLSPVLMRGGGHRRPAEKAVAVLGPDGEATGITHGGLA